VSKRDEICANGLRSSETYSPYVEWDRWVPVSAKIACFDTQIAVPFGTAAFLGIIENYATNRAYRGRDQNGPS